jgi:hypothetical protein
MLLRVRPRLVYAARLPRPWIMAKKYLRKRAEVYLMSTDRILTRAKKEQIFHSIAKVAGPAGGSVLLNHFSASHGRVPSIRGCRPPLLRFQAGGAAAWRKAGMAATSAGMAVRSGRER